ncbi:hypothetical protein [Streptomyces sp. NPDC000410]|uniref:hypothetical protein n=1 Tax=Streptomyces sp. NPDC000410 TaxID=3154254 RepID=UPI00331C3E3F
MSAGAGSVRWRGAIDCKRWDNGYVYRHYGPWVWGSATSTVWCDLGANVIAGYYIVG